MGVWEKISAQFGKPTGAAGVIVGVIMSNRGSNLERIDWGVSLLDLQPTDRVLEIGFGPGIALKKMSRIATEGIIWGIDHSEVSVRQASRRNREAVKNGRMKLIHGPVSRIGGLDIRVDKVLDINSFQFWQSPTEDLVKVRAAMAPGGIIALVHQPRKPGSTDRETDNAGKRIADFMARAGFTDVTLQTKVMKPVSTVCVLGTS